MDFIGPFLLRTVEHHFGNSDKLGSANVDSRLYVVCPGLRVDWSFLESQVLSHPVDSMDECRNNRQMDMFKTALPLKFETKLRPRFHGFSLVEVLITLGILGILAALTIPSMFQTSSTNQSAKYTAMAKDTAFMVLSAYERYRAVNATVATTVSMNDLTPYMNYVSRTTSSSVYVDWWYGLLNWDCTAWGGACLRLHNGGTLKYFDDQFGGSATTNSFRFIFDPDGRVTDGTTNGQGKGLVLYMYTDGKIMDSDHLRSGTTSSVAYGTISNGVPPWFTGF